MKNTSFVSLILLALIGALAVPAVHAQDAAPAPKEKKVSKKDLEKYDADKDGKLSPDEQAAMKADKEKMKAEKKAKKDAKKAEPEAAK